MYLYCVAVLVVATATNTESAWEIYRVPLENLNRDNKNGGINFFYPSSDDRVARQLNEFFNYDDFIRDSQAIDDIPNEWKTNDERIRTERQQLFPQPPIQTAADINACVRNCPTTSEYNPVCGSNGITYSNPSRLECAKFCGVAVQLSRYSRCPEPGLPSTGTTSSTAAPTPVSPTPPSPTPPRPTPVSPTPVTPTPVSPTPVTPTPVTPTRQPPSPITNPTPSQTTPSNLDFTVPQDILDNIFTTNYGSLIDERHEES